MAEAYHREQVWTFRVHEKKADGTVDRWAKQHTKAKAKTLESALKQLRNRFPEDKYELKYVRAEPVVSDSRKAIVRHFNEKRGSVKKKDNQEH